MKKLCIFILALFLLPAIISMGQAETYLNGTITQSNLNLGNGSVSDPAIRFSTDPDTGWYYIGSGNWGWSKNGTKKVELGNSSYEISVTGSVGTTTGAFKNGVELGQVAFVDARDYASISAALTAIGSDSRALFLAAGTWTISADLIIPANVTLVFERGAVAAIASGKTLTMNGGISAGLYQIFSGAGTAAFGTTVSKVFPQWWGAIEDSGTTDNTTPINAALATGKVVTLINGGGYYKITDNITAGVAGTVLRSPNQAQIRQTTAGKYLLNITASNVTIDNLSFYGSQYATASLTEYGVFAHGADTDNRIVGVRIKNCKMENVAYSGIHFRYANDLEALNNSVQNIHTHGILVESCSFGLIEGNRIENVVGLYADSPSGAYGVAVAEASSNRTTDPQNTDIRVIGNSVYNVPDWEGLDTHEGIRVSIINNIVRKTQIGISVSTSETNSPRDCVVAGNVVDADGAYTPQAGIIVSGKATDNRAQNIAVTGNTVRGYGKDEDLSGAIKCQLVDNLTVTGNVVYDSTTAGLVLNQYITGITVTGNTIAGLTAGGTATKVGGIVVEYSIEGHIEGNYISTGAQKCMYSASGAASTSLTWGPNNMVSSHATGPWQFVNADHGRGMELFASVTWDAGSIAIGAATSTTTTVNFDNLGDTVMVGSSLDIAGLTLTGYVNAANTVTISLANNTGGAVDLASGTYYVRVIRH